MTDAISLTDFARSFAERIERELLHIHPAGGTVVWDRLLDMRLAAER